jgi:MFS transporter, UMF1 family
MAALFESQRAQQPSHSSLQLGVLFALNEIGVPTSYLVLLLVETQLLSLIGIALFERLSKWLQNSRGCSPSRAFTIIISINLAVIGILPIYAVIGLNDSISWGLKSTGEIFVFGGFFGLMIGSVQSFSRSLFSCMIPSGFECVFFGLYEVTDKGSSWIAPLIAAAVMKATRETCGWRQGVCVCVFLFSLFFCHSRI